MYNVKILGAGSIGNHLANASRRLGWQVTLCDMDPAALQRTKEDIYPHAMANGMIQFSSSPLQKRLWEASI